MICRIYDRVILLQTFEPTQQACKPHSHPDNDITQPSMSSQMVFLDALLGFIIFIIIINHNHDHDDDDLTPYLSSCHSLGVVGQVLARPAPLAGLAINI